MVQPKQILFNGSFFNSSIFPSLGYNEGYELSENKARKKYNLPKKPRMADVNDSLARMNTYILLELNEVIELLEDNVL